VAARTSRYSKSSAGSHRRLFRVCGVVESLAIETSLHVPVRFIAVFRRKVPLLWFARSPHQTIRPIACSYKTTCLSPVVGVLAIWQFHAVAESGPGQKPNRPGYAFGQHLWLFDLIRGCGQNVDHLSPNNLKETSGKHDQISEIQDNPRGSMSKPAKSETGQLQSAHADKILGPLPNSQQCCHRLNILESRGCIAQP
jgi:hypothetical protein